MADRVDLGWSYLANRNDLEWTYMDWKTVLPGKYVTIYRDPGAASRDDAIFSGERYSRAKVYFKSGRAPGHLLLPNQFHKRLNSVPLKPKKSQVVTWVLGNKTLRSFFTADLSKVYRKFL